MSVGFKDEREAQRLACKLFPPSLPFVLHAGMQSVEEEEEDPEQKEEEQHKEEEEEQEQEKETEAEAEADAAEEKGAANP